MNPTDEQLIGQPVLVHPALSTDPAGKTGQVGIITAAETEKENIYVGFGNKGQGLYGPDALLLLRPNGQIKQNLREYADELSPDEYKSLFQITLLQELWPSTAKAKSAMSLALQSENVRRLSTHSVEDAYGLRRDQSLSR